MFCESVFLMTVSRILGICPLGKTGRLSPFLVGYSLLLLAFLFYLCLDETIREFVTTDPPDATVAPTRLSISNRVVMAAESICVFVTLGACVLGNVCRCRGFRRLTSRILAASRALDFKPRETALVVFTGLCLLAEVCVDLLEVSSWMSAFGSDGFLEYLAVYASQLICGMVLLQFVDLVVRLNKRFGRLNVLLRKRLYGFKSGANAEKTIKVSTGFSPSLFRLVDLHCRLCELVEEVSYLYGIQMFFIASYIVLYLTFCSYYCIICSISPRYNNMRAAIVSSEAALTALYIAKLCLLLGSCSATERQASLAKLILSKCIEPWNANSQYQKQIVLSLIKLQHNNTSFMCLGIIHLKLPLIINIAAAVTTYLAIIIQLQVPEIQSDKASPSDHSPATEYPSQNNSIESCNNS